MKTLRLSVLMLLAASQLGFAQTVVPGGTVSARDGFTRKGTAVLLTRNGIIQKVDKEVVLENGLRVQPDGDVMLPGGQKANLRENQLLTLRGTFEDVALSPQGTAPVSSVVTPMKKVGEEVGISSTDGVTVSSGSALVTRNGVTHRLSQELKLTNGTRVNPNGTVTYADGREITLRANQVLSFDGLLLETPERPAALPNVPRDGGVASPSANPSAPAPR